MIARDSFSSDVKAKIDVTDGYTSIKVHNMAGWLVEGVTIHLSPIDAVHMAEEILERYGNEV